MTHIEPRWLDARATGDYISVRPDALMRLVKAGRLPAPSYPIGPRNPRWDRLQLDRHFEGGGASIDIDQAVQAIADDIRSDGKRRHRNTDSTE